MGMEIVFGAGAVILALAVGWGIWRNRTRNRANDAIGDAATRDEYQHPESYNPDKYRAQLGPKR